MMLTSTRLMPRPLRRAPETLKPRPVPPKPDLTMLFPRPLPPRRELTGSRLPQQLPPLPLTRPEAKRLKPSRPSRMPRLITNPPGCSWKVRLRLTVSAEPMPSLRPTELTWRDSSTRLKSTPMRLPITNKGLPPSVHRSKLPVKKRSSIIKLRMPPMLKPEKPTD